VTTEEIVPPQQAGAFDVHEDTRDRVTWKPEYYAAARTDAGQVRFKVTQAECDALRKAGAAARQTVGSRST
jgi:hypothetical protein